MDDTGHPAFTGAKPAALPFGLLAGAMAETFEPASVPEIGRDIEQQAAQQGIGPRRRNQDGVLVLAGPARALAQPAEPTRLEVQRALSVYAHEPPIERVVAAALARHGAPGDIRVAALRIRPPAQSAPGACTR